MDPSEDHDDEGTEDRGEPRPVDKWRRNTATGALTAALALGFQQVFDPEKKDTIGIEQEAPTQPVDPDEKIELRFDPLNSHGNTVVVHAPKPDAEDPQPGS